MTIPRKAVTFELIEIAGPAGKLECLRLDAQTETAIGIVLVAHPNPTEGGTFNNKIVHTLAKTLSRLGYIAYCPNLRGVGLSEGEHSRGEFEPDDMAAVLAFARAHHPQLTRLTLAGFSFGTLIQSRLRERLTDSEVEGMILIGPAVSRYAFPNVPKGTLVIHGEEDEVISLSAVLNWARPQQLPIIVAPGVGHFFHGRLTQLAELVHEAWRKR
ncbi:alpha/beta fold hydrolase [Deefgea tanakiae]|jgi:alpha/beta superfamily hydrolase|uniref:Alpha/beta fold hydrolase n=1 Tax=Deefgea tanakiae TaxID=2865840 RepID=A0ABX8Z9F4_9NEIS|nr:alpha/beta fold hydrolase [Deefgea tanakiae]QZA79188.1 alpha/beta fold hydrolase [Deefgea tanakiae]